MCIDRQKLGSQDERHIKIEPHDGNFEGPEMGPKRWYSQIRDSWIWKFSFFFTKTTRTPMPTKPDIPEVISSFCIKKIWGAHITHTPWLGIFENVGFASTYFKKGEITVGESSCQRWRWSVVQLTEACCNAIFSSFWSVLKFEWASQLVSGL